MSKYQKWHDAIIYRARNRVLDCYSEWHHVLPRSFGGSDDPENLVQLTYREHFLIHWLLAKLTTGRKRMAMIRALRLMSSENGRRGVVISSWRVDAAKRAQRAYFESDEYERLSRERAQKVANMKYGARRQINPKRSRRVQAERANAVLEANTLRWPTADRKRLSELATMIARKDRRKNTVFAKKRPAWA